MSNRQNVEQTKCRTDTMSTDKILNRLGYVNFLTKCFYYTCNSKRKKKHFYCRHFVWSGCHFVCRHYVSQPTKLRVLSLPTSWKLYRSSYLGIYCRSSFLVVNSPSISELTFLLSRSWLSFYIRVDPPLSELTLLSLLTFLSELTL